MTKIEVRLERSESNTRKHKYVRRAFKVNLNTLDVKEVEPKLKLSPLLYAKGWSSLAEVKLGEGDVLVVTEFLMNSQGRVKGRFTVFSNKGGILYKAVYRKFKIRGSYGDPRYYKAIKRVIEKLKIPLKRENPYAHLPKSARR